MSLVSLLWQHAESSSSEFSLTHSSLWITPAFNWIHISQDTKPCHVGIHWIALPEYSLHHFVLAKLATSSIGVNLFVMEILLVQDNSSFITL